MESTTATQPQYLTPKQAAACLCVNIATVRSWAKAGYIRYGLTMGGENRRGNYRYHAGDVAKIKDQMKKAV
ncbi:helix-turn-helix domain-containing protein [Limnospira platensis]|uniref:helix-turn-helix domain-containing protein n=1 Tax=Limnospira platensis TaxID=118562 RepID=UPI003D6FAB9D